jgi:hypothetical protein
MIVARRPIAAARSQLHSLLSSWRQERPQRLTAIMLHRIIGANSLSPGITRRSAS